MNLSDLEKIHKFLNFRSENASRNYEISEIFLSLNDSRSR